MESSTDGVALVEEEGSIIIQRAGLRLRIGATETGVDCQVLDSDSEGPTDSLFLVSDRQLVRLLSAQIYALGLHDLRVPSMYNPRMPCEPDGRGSWGHCACLEGSTGPYGWCPDRCELCKKCGGMVRKVPCGNCPDCKPEDF